MTIYKKILWSVVSVAIIIVGTIGVVIYMDNIKPSEAENSENEKTNEPTNISQKIEKENKAESKHRENIDPFKQQYRPEELTDKHFQDFIHKMSHQKVEAEDKWGFFEITDERIDWLLEALEHDDVKRTLTDADVYLDILNRWHDHDFSQVDKDHNAIWRLQDGTIGKATGILSEEEEQAYIENTSESK